MLKGLHTVQFILCTFNLIRNSSTNLFDHHTVKQNKNTVTGMLTVQTMHLTGLMLSTDQLHLSLSLSFNTHIHIREKNLSCPFSDIINIPSIFNLHPVLQWGDEGAKQLISTVKLSVITSSILEAIRFCPIISLIAQ